MKAVIKATGISVDSSVTSSIDHGVIAGKQCLEKAGIDIQEVNYIFNVGVYRDHNMVEPSMAALIQKGLGINPDFVRWPVPSPAFSTDIMNGSSGAINAFHVAKSLFGAGRKGYVLVVASEAHPSMKSVEEFPITPCGAAVLLAPGEGNQGFDKFTFADTIDDYTGQESYIDFELHALNGRDTIEVETQPDYYDKLTDFAKLTASGFIMQHQIDVSKTALIAPSLSENFASHLGANLNIPEHAVVNLWADYKNPNTAVFGLGFNALVSSSNLDNFENVLFVSCGAGLNACCALYKV